MEDLVYCTVLDFQLPYHDLIIKVQIKTGNKDNSKKRSSCFSYFLMRTNAETLYKVRLYETVLMRDHSL